MFAVTFFENKNVLLSQLLNRVPSVGEDVTIKGRKAKVASITSIDEETIHVQLILEKEKVNKGKVAVVDNSKKKKK